MNVIKSTLKKKPYKKMEKRLFKELARRVEYDENYAKELCPKCFHDLYDNSEYLFKSGWREKLFFVKCITCNQIICL